MLIGECVAERERESEQRSRTSENQLPVTEQKSSLSTMSGVARADGTSSSSRWLTHAKYFSLSFSFSLIYSFKLASQLVLVSSRASYILTSFLLLLLASLLLQLVLHIRIYEGYCRIYLRGIYMKKMFFFVQFIDHNLYTVRWMMMMTW